MRSVSVWGWWAHMHAHNTYKLLCNRTGVVYCLEMNQGGEPHLTFMACNTYVPCPPPTHRYLVWTFQLWALHFKYSLHFIHELWLMCASAQKLHLTGLGRQGLHSLLVWKWFKGRAEDVLTGCLPLTWKCATDQCAGVVQMRRCFGSLLHTSSACFNTFWTLQHS